VDLLIPVFVVPGDTPEERAFLTRRAPANRLAFYGSTKNYAFQFTPTSAFDGVSEALKQPTEIR